MENDQKDPQGQTNLTDQPTTQPTPENAREVTPTSPTGNTPDPNNPEKTGTTRNYSEESANVNNVENRDYSHAPADRHTTEDQPLNEASEIKNEEEEENEEQEVKEIKHPHEHKTPESDDDFKHDM